MRVQGDVTPKSFTIDTYGADFDKVEVRVRENVKPYESEDYKGFEYDEYVFILDKRDGLAEEIEKNLGDWLLTGRNLEINPRATLFLNAKMIAIDEYTEELVEQGVL